MWSRGTEHLCHSAGSSCKQEALKLTLKNIAQMKQTT